MAWRVMGSRHIRIVMHGGHGPRSGREMVHWGSGREVRARRVLVVDGRKVGCRGVVPMKRVAGRPMGPRLSV